MPWDRKRLLGYVEAFQLILGVTDKSLYALIEYFLLVLYKKLGMVHCIYQGSQVLLPNKICIFSLKIAFALAKKVSKYGQEIPQSQTADQPMAPWGSATGHLQ